MAAVYAATHLRNASRVALKLLHREMAADPNVRARFLREGYAANSVEHPGAVRILDDDVTDDGAVFLVMELLEGETLDARWERSGHRLGAREVARLIYQLLDVLAAAHAKGIVHRDIKPENLFLTRAGVLKVLDFGVARMLEGPVTATRPGGIIGTPAFMAPEQVLDKVVDAQSDLWSVGATAFALLSKRYVHEAESAGEMMVVVGSRPARSLALVAPDVPAALAAVVDRALMFNKPDRWPDARAMQLALADAYREAFAAPMPGSEEEREEDESPPTPAAGSTPAGLGVGPALESSGRRGHRPDGRDPGHHRTHRDPVSRRAVSRERSALAVRRPGDRRTGLHRRDWNARRRDHRQQRGQGLRRVRPRPGGLGLVHRRRRFLPTARERPLPPGGLTTRHPRPRASRLRFPSSRCRPSSKRPTVGAPVSASPPVPAASVPPPHVAPPRSPSGCTPPFTIDPATGKRKWKIECL